MGSTLGEEIGTHVDSYETRELDQEAIDGALLPHLLLPLLGLPGWSRATLVPGGPRICKCSQWS